MGKQSRARSQLPPDPRGRSRVTNGSSVHAVRVPDCRWSRRFRDLVAEITSDVGGSRSLSEGQRQLIRRAATLAIACEQMEVDIASGRPVNLDEYGKMCDRMGRMFTRLGLRRVAKDITPHPLDFARSFDKQKETAAT